MKTRLEIEREAMQRAPTRTNMLLRQWQHDASDFVFANRSILFYQFASTVTKDPHAWWTRRLSAGEASLHRRRERLAKRGEVVLTVAVCDVHGRKCQEFDVLASQRLYELRDALYFASDWMFDGPTRLPSAFFFIDGAFYSDRRHPGSLDYSRSLIEWLQATREPGFVRADESKSMDLRFMDLPRIPFGEKCLYVHQGDQEHPVYFTNARLLHSHDDCPFEEAYPVLTFMRRYRKRSCYACRQNFANWIVVDSSRCPHNPSYWCQTCFRHFFQDAEGNYLPPVDYKMFPYLHDDQ